MKKRIIADVLPCLLMGTALSALGPAAQGAEPPRETLTASRLPHNPQSTAHVETAKRLAGSDPTLDKAWSFFCTPTNYNAVGPELEPAKVFDNLYAIPSSARQLTTVWAVTTREGIILIDSGEAGRTDAVIAGLRKVGLDPAQVKYILLGHGHADHYAGALQFQESYGAKVGAAGKDWDLMHPATPPANAPANAAPVPKRDLVLEEGKPVMLGGQTVHVVEIPGHTPGSLGFIFNVTENGQTHTAGIFGGTILDQGRIPTEGLNQYLASINHFLDVAKTMKVDVEIQNHALFDSTPERLAALKTRKAGDPNPFLMPQESYVKLWDIASECIRAEIAKR